MGRAVRPVALILAMLWASPAGAAVCEGMKGGPFDLDGDGFVQAMDCDDANVKTWVSPSPIKNLQFPGPTPDLFQWDPPDDPGTTAPLAYDVFRSGGPIITSSDCFSSVGGTSERDFEVPPPGGLFHYLVVPRGDCGNGEPGHGRPALACDCATSCDDGDSCTADVCDLGQCSNPLIAPQILVAPDSVTSCAGGVAELSVTAMGSGALSYQWFQDGSPIGTDNPFLSLVGLPAEDDGSQITVEVTDGCATTISPPATLSVVADATQCQGGNSGLEAPNGVGGCYDNGPLPRPHRLYGSPDQRHIASFRLSTDAPSTVEAIEYSCDTFLLRNHVGNVHLHSGEFYLVGTDLHIPGRGFDFAWRREYRSREMLSASGQGNQWDHSYNRYVEVDSGDSANRIVHNGSARFDVYIPDGSGCWTAPGFFRELCENAADGAYTLTFADKHVWSFVPLDGSAAEGKIVSSTDRNGNSMGFAYDAMGRLATITDTLGRDITVTYNTENLISAVTDFTGRSFSYEYYLLGELGGEPGDLKSVTTPAVVGTITGNDFPAGKTTTYSYTQGFADAALNHNLRTITDPLGNVVLTNVYTPTSLPADPRFDRLDRQLTPSGAIGYLYVPQTPDPTNNFAVSKTIVNDRAGKVRHYSYDALNRLVVVRNDTGLSPDPILPTGDTYNTPVNPLRPGDPAFFETKIEYNADSLPTRIVFPEDNEVQWVYDEINANRRLQGNLLSRTRLPGVLGGDQAQIAEVWEYGTDFGTSYGENRKLPQFATRDGQPGQSVGGFGTSYFDARGNQYVAVYDTDGNLETLTAPTVTLGTPDGMPQSIVHTWQYNDFGQPTQYTSPAGRVDEFTYHGAGPQMGYLHQAIVDNSGEALTTTFAYDDVGNVVSVSDPKNNTTTFIVNELNQLVCVTETSPFNYNTYFYYDADNRLLRTDRVNAGDNGLADPDNPFLTFDAVYDELDRPLQQRAEVDRDHCTWSEAEWDANDNPALLRTAEAVNGNQPTNVLRLLFDERDLPFRAIRAEGDPDVSTTQFDYDANGNLTVVRAGLEDPDADHLTTTVFDGYDRPVSVTDALGNVVTMSYDASSNPTTVRAEEAAGAGGTVRLFESDFGYDEINRPVQRDEHFFDPSTQTPIGDGFSTTKWTWNEDGRLSSSVDDNGNQTTFGYDTVRRLSLMTDAKGNSRSPAYDDNSNVTSTTDVDVSDGGGMPEVYGFVFAYDELNRLVRTTDTLGNEWEALYDSRNNLTTAFDSLDNETRFVYDGLSRLLQTARDLTDSGVGGIGGTVVDTIVTSVTWDDNSRVTSRTDDNGNATSYAYDALNRLTGVTHADGTSHQTTYDVHDMPLTVTDANGTVQTNMYDALDRLVSRSISRAMGVLGTTSEDYAYDGLSRLLTAQDDDSIVTFDYDSLSNVIRETLQIGTGPQRAVVSTFDGVGNERGLTYPSGRDVTATYDALNRVDTIASGPTTLMDYNYIGDRLELATRPSVETTYLYDGARRLTRMTHADTSGGVPQTIVDTTFGWDARYHLTAHTDQLGGDDRSFGYDSAGRLIQTAIAGPSPQTVDYLLDGARNRMDVTGGPDAGTYASDPTIPEPADFQVNQYTTTPTTTRTYDLNGNWTGRNLGQAGERSYSYDYRNRLVATDGGAGGIAFTYAYDALGRRIAKIDTTSGQETRFFRSGSRVVEQRDGAGSATASYVIPEINDEVLVMFEEADLNGNTVLDTYWYHGDHNGNVLAVTDANAGIVESYRYGNYGAPEFFDAGGGSIPGTQIGNPYLFAGRRFDEETDFYYNRTRYLDPRAGRFTTRDSIGAWGDPSSLGNGYAYAAGNPWTFSDPTGEMMYVKIPGIGGDVTKTCYSAEPYFIANSFSFGVRREMKESGEKGGTEDINIGIGELEECSTSPMRTELTGSADGRAKPRHSGGFSLDDRVGVRTSVNVPKIPSDQNYTVRSKVSEGLSAASGAPLATAETFAPRFWMIDSLTYPGTHEMTSMMPMQLQDAMNKQARALRVLSVILRNRHGTMKAIISNMR